MLIAGSNGKGSTSALLAAMGKAAGYRTALYTSPHLETVEERLRVDGRTVPADRLGKLLTHVVERAETRLGQLPTYFEALTAAAFLWFADERVDLAVIEVGLGGRLDATNLCEPVLSLITSISLEHRELLGDTLDAIAREKAGILRRGRPALSWAEAPEAVAALGEAAAAAGADWSAADRQVVVESRRPAGWDAQAMTLRTPAATAAYRIHLLGRHQSRNLGLAVRAAETLSQIGFSAFDRTAIAAGAAACRWPGRAEMVALPDGRRVMLDAAHNAEGALVLAELLHDLQPAPRALDLVFGALGDKDVAAMLHVLVPLARNLIVTTAPSPRARQAEDLAPLAEAAAAAVIPMSGRSDATDAPAAPAASVAPGAIAAVRATTPRIWCEPEPAAALARALDLGADLLVICGSIFLVGDLRQELRRRQGVPPAAADLSLA